MKLQIRQEPVTDNPASAFFRPIKLEELKALRATVRLSAVAARVTIGAEVSLLLCGDDFIRDLNSTYRGKDSPTDVLSFAQEDPLLLGDVVISVETATRQAAAADWPLKSELALLASHGLLHLLGYDDESEDGALEMENLSRAALAKAGVAMPDGDHPFFTRAHLPASGPLPPETGG